MDNNPELHPSRILRHNRLTIPIDWLRKHKIKEGDLVMLVSNNEEIRIVTMDKVFGKSSLAGKVIKYVDNSKVS